MRPLHRAAALMAAVALGIPSVTFAQVDKTLDDSSPPRSIVARGPSRYRVHSGNTVLDVPGDTVWIGRRAGNTGNYWEVGRGPWRPGSGNDDGLWSWDGPVHGDSLQGWWPVLGIMNSTGGFTLTDDQRPWWAIDIGNNANYAIAQGPGHKRTFGVVGVWHRDPGNSGAGVGQGVGWTPLSGSCGATAT